MPLITLADRALVVVSGQDAEELLQGLITTDLAALMPNEARAGALLTPQGKILFDFLISRMQDGFRLETSADQAAGLLKRLTLYKLRAAVALALEQAVSVAVSFDPVDGGVKDVRFETAGLMLYRLYGLDGDGDAGAYEQARIGAGIAVSGADFALQDAFPHDVLLDRNGGLSFRKGCYVGQEVVSRMQHRGTARRRVTLVTGRAPLPASGADITVNGRSIGTLGSVAGDRGLAIVRIDKAGAAMAAGIDILAGDVPVTLALPDWTGLSFPVAAADEAIA